jgi:hypothetical protein
MKLLTLLAVIAAGLWLPYAFMQAMQLQAHIDQRNAALERIARMGR